MGANINKPAIVEIKKELAVGDDLQKRKDKNELDHFYYYVY